MSRKQCTKCLFGDKCNSSELCDDYYPVDSNMADDTMDEMIQNCYEEFQQEWNEYIEKFFD